MQRAFVLLLLTGLCALAPCSGRRLQQQNATSNASSAFPSGFIRVQGTRFVDSQCRDFTFVGVNTWRLLEALAGLTGVQVNGDNPVDWMFQVAQASNITVIRAFATGVTPELPLQIEPGVYNQAALKALDQMMDLAAKRGLKVTLILARNWGPPDAKSNFASWNGRPTPDDFFSSPQARQQFKDHISFIVNRTNTVNGRVYRDDPTIFSWNLMNEPRYFENSTHCQGSPQACADNLQSWIEDISAHLKKVDPNHLVAVGEEGFYGANSTKRNNNPGAAGGSNWAAETGQDFERNQGIPTIDYAEIHTWPDNWNVSAEFSADWVKSHMEDARKMGKPLVHEEFGKNVTSHNQTAIDQERTPSFKVLFALFNTSLEQGDVLRGSQYWMWDPNLFSPANPGWANYSQDQVLTNETTFTGIILPTAVAVAARSASSPAVQGCTPGSAPADGAATDGHGAGRKLLSAAWAAVTSPFKAHTSHAPAAATVDSGLGGHSFGLAGVED